jgi:hypothetical protein
MSAAALLLIFLSRARKKCGHGLKSMVKLGQKGGFYPKQIVNSDFFMSFIYTSFLFLCVKPSKSFLNFFNSRKRHVKTRNKILGGLTIFQYILIF